MYSFRPEPDPGEREAVVAALQRLLAEEGDGPSAYRSEWRRSGIEEGVSAGDLEQMEA